MNQSLPKNPFWFALHFIKKYKWGLLIMALFEAGQAGCQILLPYAIKEIIDSATTSNTNDLLTLVKPHLITFASLSVGILLFSRASGALLVMIGPKLRKYSRSTIYSYLQKHSHRFFTSNFSGALANRINEVSVGINHSLWTVLFDFWPVLITFSVSLGLLFSAHDYLGFYLGVWIFFYVSISFWLASIARHYSKSYAAARSKVSGKLVDSVTNILNSKLFARLDFEEQNLEEHLDFEVKKGQETLWFMERIRWFQFSFALILQVGVLVFAIRLWQDKQLSVGTFAMVTSLSLLVINDARGLSRRFLEFFEYIGNINDGVSIMITDHEITDPKKAKPLEIQSGLVEFRQVDFKYQEGKEVFKKLNLKIQPRERVGLVGFSGSGKSTLVNLLLRLYDIQSGEILIDGQNISVSKQDTLRDSIAMIPQDPTLFHRSLLENIRYGRLEATEEEVFAAAKLAHADDFIREMPEGYQSLVGERGVKLSGGQRQRIAIARAILKNAPILVLDEATSSLDSHTEWEIQKGLDNLMKDKTVIVIAHRLSTISHLDRIIVFHNGQVVESGRHEVLIKNQSHYFHLWSMQAGGFLPTSENDRNGKNI